MHPSLNSFFKLLHRLQKTKHRFAWGLYRLWLAFLALLRHKSSHFCSSISKSERPQNGSDISLSSSGSPAFGERSNATIMPSYFPRSTDLSNLPATSVPLISSSAYISQAPLILNDYVPHSFGAVNALASPSQSSENVRPKASHTSSSRVVRPILPSLLRYNKEFKSTTEKAIDSIPATTTDFRPLRGECGEWESYFHPEGALLFFDAKRDIVTDIYMYDSTLREEVEEVICHIDDLAKTQSQLKKRPEAPLIIALNVHGSSAPSWGYYFVGHRQ